MGGIVDICAERGLVVTNIFQIKIINGAITIFFSIELSFVIKEIQVCTWEKRYEQINRL